MLKIQLYRCEIWKFRKIIVISQRHISPLQREVIVKSLQVQDYVEGPVIDVLNKESEMWVFGKDVKGREVYIKITLGYQNGQTICISFHVAEHPLVYPFK